jgi:YNFM family putative membrane transporter
MFDRRFLLTNAALLLTGFATFGALYDVQPNLPTFSLQFGVSPATASLALSSTTIVLAFAMLIVGALAESWARKATIATSLAASAVITIGIAYAPSFNTLLALRVLEGIALSGVPAVAMAYLSEEVPPQALGLAMGVYVGGTALGGMFGRLAVGIISEFHGWRTALAFMGVMNALCAIGVIALLPASRNFFPQRQSIVQALAAYRNHLNDGGLRALYLVSFVAMGGFVAVYNYLGYHLSKAPYLMSQGQIGSVFLVYLVGSAAAPAMGRLADKFTRKNLLWISFVLLFIGLGLTLAGPLPWIILGLLIFTFAFFSVHSLASSWVGRRAFSDKAHAASLYLFTYYLGSSFLGTFAGIAYAAHGWAGTVAVSAAGFAVGLIVSIGYLRTIKAKLAPATA